MGGQQLPRRVPSLLERGRVGASSMQDSSEKPWRGSRRRLYGQRTATGAHVGVTWVTWAGDGMGDAGLGSRAWHDDRVRGGARRGHVGWRARGSGGSVGVGAAQRSAAQLGSGGSGRLIESGHEGQRAVRGTRSHRRRGSVAAGAGARWSAVGEASNVTGLECGLYRRRAQVEGAAANVQPWHRKTCRRAGP